MRRIVGAGIAVTLVGLAVVGSADAASPQSSATNVTAVKVFKVHGRVKVDVTVSQPDARDRTPSRSATNRGVVLMAVHGDDGELLAAQSARIGLPVSVPGAPAIQETYRFALGPAASRRVASEADVQVNVVADTRLDSNGPADGGMSISTDTATADATVRPLADDPVRWQYFWVNFTTGPWCSIVYDGCSASWNPRSTPPFSNGQIVTIRTDRSRSEVPLELLDNTDLIRGATASGGLASGRFLVEDGHMKLWHGSFIHSGNTGAPGTPGGPLYLNVTGTGSHDWLIYGYLACDEDDCTIPPHG